MSTLLAELARGPQEDLGGNWEAWLHSGAMIGRFELVRELGRGGFGIVWEARDRELRRGVAFKAVRAGDRASLREEALAHEAEAVAQLAHPNLVTIYDVGRCEHGPYLVLELLRGRPLSEQLEQGRLPVRDALHLATEIAKGLAHAHAAGVVHRDLKPANVLICEDGQVKVLDFGLAHAFGRKRITGGTPAFMAPEQWEDAPEDERTDIFALGVILYWSLSGELPFAGKSSESTAPQLEVPDLPELGELVAQMLATSPVDRPRNGAAALASLQRVAERLPQSSAGLKAPVRVRKRRGWWRTALSVGAALLVLPAVIFFAFRPYLHRATPNKIKSLIVLPFVNVAANPDAEYLSDGIADGLINSLSQIPELRVIARTTAFRYKGKEHELEGLRRQLSVDSVLSGRVQQVGNKLVIQADLVDTGTGSQLWGEQYSRPFADALFIQEEITKSITDKLRPRLARDVHNRVARRYTDNPDAYQLYLKGRFFLTKYTKDGYTRSKEYFQQAVTLDPNYALVYAELAITYTLAAEFTGERGSEAYPQARRYALKALALDEQLAEAHASLALIGVGTWDWTTAEKEYKRAIELNPNLSRVHNAYGVYLNAMGRREDAIAEYRMAQQLDPGNLLPASNIGSYSCDLGQYERGIPTLKDVLALDPTFLPAYLGLARCYLRQQKYAEAIAALEEARSLHLSGRQTLGILAYADAVSGNREDALRILDELKSAAETDDDALIRIAQVYVGLDDKERAFEWLEKAYQRRAHWLRALKLDFIYDPLRSDPRFKELLRRVGLPP